MRSFNALCTHSMDADGADAPPVHHRRSTQATAPLNGEARLGIGDCLGPCTAARCVVLPGDHGIKHRAVDIDPSNKPRSLEEYMASNRLPGKTTVAAIA